MPKLTPEENDTPTVPMTAENLNDLLKRVAPATNAPSMTTTATSTSTPPAAVPPPPVQQTTQPPPQTQQSQQPPIQVFGPPATSLSTEAILGYSYQPATSQPPPPPPQSQEVGPRKPITDPLDQARKKSSEETRQKADLALGRLLSDYPSTRLVNVRLLWRDPETREYRGKGRRKNVSVNEVRDPESFCEGPDGTIYGGEWIMGYMPADQGKRFDDPRAWYEFEFARDGPPPPREWTIDQPVRQTAYLEVEGMGQVSLDVLKGLFEGIAKQTVDDALKRNEQPSPMHTSYHGTPATASPFPPYSQFRDPKAEEREKRLEEQIAEQRKQLDMLMQRLAEKDREALEAKHRAELQALSDKNARELESVLSKLTAVEARLNQPPPPPPPATDFGSLLANALPHIKDIVTSVRTAEIENHRREQEDRQRQREEERLLREREREEYRERREREREEERSRREAAEREAAQAREMARQTLEQYRLMGEQTLTNARAIADVVTKQQDPGPMLSVMNAMSSQAVQQAQLVGTLIKNNIVSAGGNSGTNWGEVLGNAFEMLGNVGAAWAEATAAKAKAAPQTRPQPAPLPPPATTPLEGVQSRPPAPPPVPAPPPAPAQLPSQPPAQPPVPTQPQPPTQPNPLAMLIAAINQAIANKEPPRLVAGKLASVVHVTQEFGLLESARPMAEALRRLIDDPQKFLRETYQQADSAYLDEIAKVFSSLCVFGDESKETSQDATSTRKTDAAEADKAKTSEVAATGGNEAKAGGTVTEEAKADRAKAGEAEAGKAGTTEAGKADVAGTDNKAEVGRAETGKAETGGDGGSKDGGQRRRRGRPRKQRNVAPEAAPAEATPSAPPAGSGPVSTGATNALQGA